MGTTSKNKGITTQGVWPEKQPSSLILNFFEIVDIIGKNAKKVNCLLRNIKDAITSNSINDNTIQIKDHGMSWEFLVTKDPDGNFGLLFNGLNR